MKLFQQVLPAMRELTEKERREARATAAGFRNVGTVIDRLLEEVDRLHAERAEWIMRLRAEGLCERCFKPRPHTHQES